MTKFDHYLQRVPLGIKALQIDSVMPATNGWILVLIGGDEPYQCGQQWSMCNNPKAGDYILERKYECILMGKKKFEDRYIKDS